MKPVPAVGRTAPYLSRFSTTGANRLKRRTARIEVRGWQRRHGSRIIELAGWDEPSNGEGGIRTRDTGVNPYDGLANRWFQPLTHLSTGRDSKPAGMAR